MEPIDYDVSMPTPSRSRRKARGEIETLPSGSLRVRVYAGLDPVSRKRRYLVETIPAGPDAAREADRVRARLLDEVDEHRGRQATAAPCQAERPLPAGDASAPTRPVMPAASVEVVFYGMHSSMAVEIMRGVERVVGEHRLAVGFTDVARQLSEGRFWAEDLLSRRPTGVITVHLGTTVDQHALLGANAIPLVALDPTDDPPHTVPSVGATHESGAVEACRHLLDLGHRRIAILTGPVEHLCARVRLEGARAAMNLAGVGVDERLIRLGRAFSFEEGQRQGQVLLSLPDPPTAILCGNDLQALGVYEAARRAGRTIPTDLSVIGFDDTPNACWCGPTLTTVRQPFVEMGSTAARLVLSLAAGATLPQTRIELATTLVVRDSTAPPRDR